MCIYIYIDVRKQMEMYMYRYMYMYMYMGLEDRYGVSFNCFHIVFHDKDHCDRQPHCKLAHGLSDR